MGYFTKIDLVRQSKLASGDTASYQGSLNLSGNLTGNTALFNGTVNILSGNTSNPPLKIGAGILTTVPSSGYIENDGNFLYYTDNSNIRHLLTSGGTNIVLTTTGTSGAATLSGNNLNIPQYSGLILSGTGFVKVSGLSISYDNSTYPTINQVILNQSASAQTATFWINSGATFGYSGNSLFTKFNNNGIIDFNNTEPIIIPRLPIDPTSAITQNGMIYYNSSGNTISAVVNNNIFSIYPLKNYKKEMYIIGVNEVIFPMQFAGTLSLVTGATTLNSFQYKIGAGGTYGTLTSPITYPDNTDMYITYNYINLTSSFGWIRLIGKDN